MINPKFGIVVPAYNEEEDIAATLDALIHLEGSKEIIIVDDGSKDRTAEIVSKYESRGVRLIRQPKNMGRCEARNRGIREAHAEIVIILNADVQLPADFLGRIEKHYAAGADYVLVEARITNVDRLFPRYLEAQHQWLYHDADWIEWTEGFSCKTDAAIKAGLFPTGFPLKLTSGEDGYFADQLKRLKYKKVIDRSIVVEHIAPASLRGYWKQRFERGYAGPPVRFYLEKTPLPELSRRLIRSSISYLFSIVLPVRVLKEAWDVCKFNPAGRKDWLGFSWAAYVELLARFYGEWVAYLELKKVEHGSGR